MHNFIELFSRLEWANDTTYRLSILVKLLEKEKIDSYVAVFHLVHCPYR